ncbi:MAG TPA: serine/threonine-protein kinase [Kofleriaceae bacterium]|nr:serine/threonine-protein kinase [Kofleriaceae bacterium]
MIEKLESGGMAEVFRAESQGLQGFRKQVAIKRVLPHLSEKKKFISMFLDEARLSAQLSHSNCVQVFDIGVGDQAYFIVMEFVDGANLKSIGEAARKQGRGFPIAAATYIAHEICKGLSYAHELTDQEGIPLQLVHRDMSPPNVLVTKYGEVKIVDFGLAKASSQLEKSEPGIIKGKFAYLSPEAALGADVDNRADIFAVGIMLWELLASQRLFLGDTDFQTVQKVQLAKVPSISQINRKVPPELERIVNKALARDPDQRYATAREFGQALSKFMFSFAEPVSGYDIAAIVRDTMRDKENARAAHGSIIHKLIEEALLEFTSLKGDAPGSGVLRAAAAPLNADLFLDPRDVANKIAIGAKPPGYDPVRAYLPHDVFDQGNLSVLEETGPTLLLGRSLSSSPPPPVSTGIPKDVSLVASSGPHASGATSAGRGTTIGVVVFLLLVAVASAAWFTGIIPHH